MWDKIKNQFLKDGIVLNLALSRPTLSKQPRCPRLARPNSLDQTIYEEMLKKHFFASIPTSIFPDFSAKVKAQVQLGNIVVASCLPYPLQIGDSGG